MKIQIFGDGALAKEITYGLLSNSYLTLNCESVSYVGPSDLVDQFSKSILGMQDPLVKKKIFETLSPEFRSRFVTLIHSRALLFPDVKIGSGAIVNANSVLSYGVSLGLNVLINWNVTIGHQVSIGDNTSIGPGTTISGEVQIGNNCMLGAGVIVNPGVKIGDNVCVGAGAVVTKNIISNVTVVGVPARLLHPESK
jgi:sugar O-acyltransferase (sialic acid O-acetyltransferase NeuD family)